MLVAICEDDKTIRDYENLLIHQWAENQKIKIIVDCYSSAENFLFESEDKIEYDFLLLDIQMGKMNGFELAKVLRKRGFNGSLAFLTGIMDYAIEGYEVGAVRYILKPIKEDNLFNVLNIVYEEYQQQKKDCYILQIGTDVLKIPFDEIVYIEAEGHYVHLKSKKIDKQWKASFSSIAADFDNHGFFCLRRGLLVNLLHIQKITKSDCIMNDGEILPVARNSYENLNKAFIEFYKEKKL